MNPPAPETQAETLAGTLDIDDLKNMDSAVLHGPGPAAPGLTSGESANPAAASDIEPGTLKIDELKRLEGDQP